MDMIDINKCSVNLFTTVKKDFDEFELGKQVGKAEILYELHKKPINLFILLKQGKKVLTEERTIESEAKFTIKLAIGE